jgi:putative acetyltransferase
MLEITLEIHKPNRPDAVQLINDLDSYLNTLYPPDSNYLLDINILMQPPFRFVLAFVQEEAVGCAAIRLFDDYAEVKRMYVKPAYRGNGIAHRLLDKLESLAQEAGIRVLRLETGTRQQEAMKLYERCGFKRCAVFGNYEDSPYSIFYEKQLD